MGSLAAEADGASLSYNTQSDSALPAITNWSFLPRGPPTIAANSFNLASTQGLSLTEPAFGSVTLASLTLGITQATNVATEQPGSSSFGHALLHAASSAAPISPRPAEQISNQDGNLSPSQIFTSGTDSWAAAAGSDFSLSLTAGPLSASGTVGFLYNSGSAVARATRSKRLDVRVA